MRTFISYTTYGRVGAMGAEFSSGFLDPAHLASLPMNRYPLVGAPSFVSNGQQPFMWQGIREILLPWPTDGHEQSPYAYMRLLYNPSGEDWPSNSACALFSATHVLSITAISTAAAAAVATLLQVTLLVVLCPPSLACGTSLSG